MRGDREKYSVDKYESLLELYKENTGLNDYSSYQGAWNYLFEFIDEREIEVYEMEEKDAIEFCNHLKKACDSGYGELSEQQAERYVQDLGNMFDWVSTNTNYIDWHPFFDALDEVEFEYDDRETKKRDVPLEELRRAIHDIKLPTLLMTVVLLAKTGIRAGEAVNLEYDDINLEHPISETLPRPRSEIAPYPDSIYIDSSKHGNKKKSYREIPIDTELKRTLVWYISLTPIPVENEMNPLLVDLQGKDTQYEQINSQHVHYLITNWAKDQGWWIKPDHQMNVTPHWFRHWFTTILRARIDQDDLLMGTPKEYVQGLRGDTGKGSVIDTYSHEWESLRGSDDPTYREIYEDAMPSLLSGSFDDSGVENMKNFADENIEIR